MASNSFKVKNSLVLTPKDLSTLTSPEAGDLACDINDSNKIKRYDALTSSWVEVGSGGVGGVDIMFVQDFESAGLSSFTQTGLSLSQTDPLRGRVSALLTHQSAINQSFKQTVSVDRKFRGQAMTLTLDSKSSASQGNLVITVRDETNAANLIASSQLQLANDVNGKKTTVGFTLPETCASLSYTIIALPQAGSPVSRIDDIICQLAETALLETAVEVPNVTGWQGYTPTFQGFGTPSNVEFEWRQVGENVEIRGKFVSGTSTAVEARVGLPGGLTSAGTGLIPSIQIIGKGSRSTSTTTFFSGITVLIEPSVSYITFGAESSSTAGVAKQTATAIFGNSDTISFFASVPCSGLSATTTKTIPLTQSGLVQEVDSTLKVNTPVRGTTSTGVYNFTNTQTSIGSDVLFQASATLGSTFTIQKTGIYALSFSVVSSLSNSTSAAAGISRNQTSAGTTAAENLNAAELLALSRDTDVAGGAAKFSSTSWTGLLNVGDIIRFHGNPGDVAVASSSTATISQQGSLKQVSVSSDQKITIPTSELRFEGASARGTGSEASTVQFQSLAKLRGDAFSVSNSNGTIITVLKKGKLSLSASLITTTASSFAITKNQVINSSFNPTVSEMIASATTVTPTFHASVSCEIYAQIGDIIRVSSGGTPNSSSFCNFNLAFQEQDIAVSVTNTLPQFSESDTSLRLSGANGFGSSATTTRRFASVLQNVGTDVQYVDSPTLGGQFTALASGIYNVSFSEQSTANVADVNINIAINGTVVAYDNQTYNTANATAKNINCSWQGYLTIGDIVTATANGGSSTNNGADARFTISKVGKPNVTGVNVTPFVNVPQPDTEAIEVVTSTTTFGSTNTGVPVLAISKNTNKGVIAVSSSATTGTSFIALKRCDVVISSSATALSAAGTVYITKNSTALTAATPNGVLTQQSITAFPSSSNVSATTTLEAGDIIRVQRDTVNITRIDNVTLTATALSDQILTAPESFSTDTASLSYASSSLYNLTTLANAPVGTYITFTYAANTNTRTQTTTPPSQSPADMNANGIQIFTRAFNAPSTAGNPAAIAIQIGKGLKGKSLDLYKSAGKVVAGSLDYLFIGNDMNGAAIKDYNEVTGILLVDAGLVPLAANATHTFVFSDLAGQTSGYLVINASKSPALTGVPQLLPRIATLSDVKASGTAGGTATSGSYQTRTLNTLSDPTGIVTSLASNQFTLPAGEYYIEASAPAYNCELHKLRIQNVSDASTSLIGEVAYSRVVANAAVSALLKGSITISSAKTFELQHRVGTTQAASGFGIATSFGDNEVYASIKITKVK